MIWLALAAQLAIGSVVLKPADFLDGRVIADGNGAPVVMLTLSPNALKAQAKSSDVTLDGKALIVRRIDATIELDGQPDFATAEKLALALTGKPPLPDSLDE